MKDDTKEQKMLRDFQLRQDNQELKDTLKEFEERCEYLLRVVADREAENLCLRALVKHYIDRPAILSHER